MTWTRTHGPRLSLSRSSARGRGHLVGGMGGTGHATPPRLAATFSRAPAPRLATVGARRFSRLQAAHSCSVRQGRTTHQRLQRTTARGFRAWPRLRRRHARQRPGVPPSVSACRPLVSALPATTPLVARGRDASSICAIYGAAQSAEGSIFNALCVSHFVPLVMRPAHIAHTANSLDHRPPGAPRHSGGMAAGPFCWPVYRHFGRCSPIA